MIFTNKTNTKRENTLSGNWIKLKYKYDSIILSDTDSTEKKIYVSIVSIGNTTTKLAESQTYVCRQNGHSSCLIRLLCTMLVRTAAASKGYQSLQHVQRKAVEQWHKIISGSLRTIYRTVRLIEFYSTAALSTSWFLIFCFWTSIIVHWTGSWGTIIPLWAL